MNSYKGTFINHEDSRGGLTKLSLYYISHFVKATAKGVGRGSKIPKNGLLIPKPRGQF